LRAGAVGRYIPAIEQAEACTTNGTANPAWLFVDIAAAKRQIGERTLWVDERTDGAGVGAGFLSFPYTHIKEREQTL
jgi:hypothetical protein